MKQSLQLKMGQQLAMTPQLQQAIKLLQLSTLDLQMEIQNAIESNPLLEIADETVGAESPSQDKDSEYTPSSDDYTDRNEAQDYYSDSAYSDEDSDHSPGNSELSYSDTTNTPDIPEDLPVDSSWDDIYDGSSALTKPADNDYNYLENQSGEEESLQDHLCWQLEMSPFSPQDQLIAFTLIDSIGDDGYLAESIESILDTLQHNHTDRQFEHDEVEMVLKRIQLFDPVGVGARDLKECLQIQLKQFSPETPWIAQARQLVDHHLDLLGTRQFSTLMRKMRLDEGQLQQVIKLIQRLDPKPGEKVKTAATQYIVPDVFVRKYRNLWIAELNSEFSPKLRVNALYANLIRRGDTSGDSQYIRNHLQEARWFIKSLKSRNETLLKVAQSIVDKQTDFFEQGEIAMKPLVLREIAEAVEMHESTISRITTQKYMHTPRGILEFKYFFSSHVSGEGGDEHSATAIRARIKTLIESEDSRKPMSDSKLAQILNNEGINVARRTVAKYREAMNIPTSNDRRRWV
jgi:RNA polymerase sigma-54 factor